MEETLLNRLQQMINNIQILSDSANKLNIVSVLDDVRIKEAEIICNKLETFINRFNVELNNYFRLSNDPSADDVSRFTSIQLQAEENQIELSLKLKHQKPEASDSHKLSSKLPKLDLPTFDGNILRWQEFWDQYKSNIHERDLPDVDKLLYLKCSLQGPAKKTIEGLESTTKNYQIAITTLRDRYGKENHIIDAHYSALSKVQPADTSTKDCRRVLNEVERHLRVLNSLGEDVSHNHLRHLILEKFPEDLVYELKTKLKTESIEEIRSELQRTISSREEAGRLVQQRNSTKPNNFTIETLHTSNKINWTRPRTRHDTQPRQPLYKQRYRPSQEREKGNFKKEFGKFNNKAEAKQTDKPYERRPENYNKRKFDSQVQAKEPSRKRFRCACVFCGEEHYNDECTKLKTLKERKEKIKDLCYSCLRKGHIIKNCNYMKPCVHCGGRHNRALCPKRFPQKRHNSTSTNMHINAKGRTVLQTAVAKVMKEGDKSTYIPCRILLDSGSQRSYVTERIVKKLKLDVEEENRLSVFTFGAEAPLEYDSSLVKIHLKFKTNNERTIYANVVPIISHHVPFPREEINNLQYEFDLADDGSQGDEIDILIGNDYYFSLLSAKKITVKENLYLINSELGWILSGQLTPESDEPELKVITYFQANSLSKLNKPDLPLDKVNLKTLWDLESIGIVDSPKLTREEEAIRNFNETTQFINGRYSIRWPWKEYPPNLPSNFGMAFGRLVNLVKRVDSTSLQSYEETLKFQLDNRIIEVVPDAEYNSNRPIHYLPHHGVQHPEKSMRIVYDASAKIKDSKSLNECLYCGPSLVEDLTCILIRFRSHRIGLSADVEKAFLQILIQNEDRDVTRFLWIKNISKPVTKENLLHLRFCRVPFGIISSPFLLNATIKHHLSKGSNRLKKVVDDIYVDNLVTGTDSIEEALNLYKDSRQSFQEISMNLRSWSSNSKTFMKQVTDTCDKEVVKILGLDWNLDQDTIKLRHKNTKEAKSKREVLRNIAEVYDPCGFAAPSLLPAKLFLQNLWKEKDLKWDTTFPFELISKWKDISTNLDDISDTSLPRHFAKQPDGNNQLHCFTDASTKAYAAVVYIVNSKGKGFIIGKSRLVPIKDKEDLKIPRLELLGAVIGNRLLKYAEKSLHLKITQQFLWTDSQIVIDWINSEKLLTPFVARRVNEIKENKKVIVRYVPTELNPADIGTRLGKTKSEKSYWLNGPDFLLQKPNTWPSTRLKELSLLTREGLPNAETKPTKKVNPSEQAKKEQVDKISSKEREPQETQNHTDEERSRVQEVKLLQKQHFPDEVNGKVTHLTRNLGLFIDVDGLLRSKGRLSNSNMSYDTRYPVVLPKNCEFTNNMIKKVHEENYHVGANHTLSIIRHLYWIPQGKSQVQKILRKCPKCIKHGGGPYQLPATPALPPERANYSSPFTYTGLDYLGPVLVNTENGVKKRWICLYTCLAIRAIHLEIVKDMTAEEALLALRRMISSRGIPTVITSDNAQQFKLSAEVLAKPFCIQNHIRWKFIPQLSPWFGGFYERLVGLVKHCLKRTLQKNLLNDSQLLTVIKEIEAVLNTRLLTSIDAEQDYILKPSDFLSMRKCITVDATSEDLAIQGTVTKTDLIQSWRRGLKILNEFKSMFLNRYLPSLRERYRHSPKESRVTSKLTPKIGQVVQIKGDTSNRQNWKVGKITELSEGKDGACRTAKVKVGNTEYTRSISQLYPLEIEEEEPEFLSGAADPHANSDSHDSDKSQKYQDVINDDDMSTDEALELRPFSATVNTIESHPGGRPEE